MKFEKIKVYNFENAFRGMRNPKNSWARSDSVFGLMNHENEDDINLAYDVADKWAQAAGFEPGTLEHEYNWGEYTSWLLKNGTLEVGNNCSYVAYIGPKDMKLAQTLIRGGSEHRKFMRQIFVSVDITAPLYW